jgi:hypothetical protein
MGVLRRLREWRENKDGTLEGPALKTEELSLGGDGPATSFADIGGGSGGLWTEDANSPGAVSGQETYTVTLDGAYDLVLLDVRVLADGSNGEVGLTLNGDSGANYDYTTYNGSTTTGASEIKLSSDQRRVEAASLLITGRWNDRAIATTQNGLASGVEAQVANNSNITSPLTSITIRLEFGQPAEIVAYGRDVL